MTSWRLVSQQSSSSTLLFTGDAKENVEGRLIEDQHAAISRHLPGWPPWPTNEFVDGIVGAIEPSVAVISSAYVSQYGLPRGDDEHVCRSERRNVLGGNTRERDDLHEWAGTGCRTGTRGPTEASIFLWKSPPRRPQPSATPGLCVVGSNRRIA